MRVFQLIVGLIMFSLSVADAWATTEEEALSVVAKNGTSSAANPMMINLALKDGKFHLGEVCTRLVGEIPSMIQREDFLKAAAPVLRAEVAEEVRRLPAEAGLISLDALKKMGLALEFDPGEMTLSISPAVTQRPKSHISLSAGEDVGAPDRLSKQSTISGYVNLHGTAQYTGKSSGSNTSMSEAVGSTAAVRVLNVVIENEATYSNGALTRQGTRAVYDQPDKALEDFSTAIEINPEFPRAYINRSFIYMERNDTQKALQDYNSYLKLMSPYDISGNILNPPVSDALGNRGLIYSKTGRYEKALIDFDLAIKLNPQNLNNYLNRAFAYYKLGRIAEARQDALIMERMGVVIDPAFRKLLQLR